MHAIEGSGNVPAFLTKLWRLVDDVKTNDLISWTQVSNMSQAKFLLGLVSLGVTCPTQVSTAFSNIIVYICHSVRRMTV